MNEKQIVLVKWIISLVISINIGNIVMNFFYAVDINVWIARLLGAIFTGLAGYLFHTYWIEKKGFC